MGYRIHTTSPENVAVLYVANPEEYFEDDEMDVGSSLVFNDLGNLEAWVMVGDPSEMIDFAIKILDAAKDVQVIDLREK